MSHETHPSSIRCSQEELAWHPGDGDEVQDRSGPGPDTGVENQNEAGLRAADCEGNRMTFFYLKSQGPLSKDGPLVPATSLDEKGRCCGRKPIKYTSRWSTATGPHYFCDRCDRAFDLETKQQIENWAWKESGS